MFYPKSVERLKPTISILRVYAWGANSGRSARPTRIFSSLGQDLRARGRNMECFSLFTVRFSWELKAEYIPSSSNYDTADSKTSLSMIAWMDDPYVRTSKGLRPVLYVAKATMTAFMDSNSTGYVHSGCMA